MIGAIERGDQRELADDAVAGDSVAIEGGPCMLAAGLFSSRSPDHGIAKIGAGRSFPLD